MRIFINFPAGVDQEDYQRLQEIQQRGAVVTFEKYRTFTPTTFAREHGLHPSSISRLFARPDCPKIDGKIGPSGRVIKFTPSLELTEFLTKHAAK